MSVRNALVQILLTLSLALTGVAFVVVLFCRKMLGDCYYRRRGDHRYGYRAASRQRTIGDGHDRSGSDEGAGHVGTRLSLDEDLDSPPPPALTVSAANRRTMADRSIRRMIAASRHLHAVGGATWADDRAMSLRKAQCGRSARAPR